MTGQATGGRRQETAERPAGTGGNAWSVSHSAMFAMAVLLLISVHAREAFGDTRADFSDPPTVRNATGNVLSRPEFRNLSRIELGPGGEPADRLTPNQQQETTREVRTRTGNDGPLAELLSAIFGGAASLIVIIVLVVVLGGIVALIVLGLRRWERAGRRATSGTADAATDDEPEPQFTPGEKPADEWLAAAHAAATANRFDEALALLLLGAMSHAERTGLIRPRRGLTYRDYLRAIPESSEWHTTLRLLIRAYAPVGFGRRIATAAMFAEVVHPYEAALAAEQTP